MILPAGLVERIWFRSALLKLYMWVRLHLAGLAVTWLGFISVASHCVPPLSLAILVGLYKGC